MPHFALALARKGIQPWMSIAASLALMMLIAGCVPGADFRPIPPYDPTVYRLGVADRLSIVTYGDEHLSREFRVNESGNISMPLIGDINAAGLTTTELAASIEEGLRKRQILRRPSVSVEVVSFRPISVLGEVVKPGQLPYQPGLTLLTAVAAAGGFTYRAVQDHAYVIRQDGKSRVSGRIEPEDYVKPGDIIKIYERYF